MNRKLNTILLNIFFLFTLILLITPSVNASNSSEQNNDYINYQNNVKNTTMINANNINNDIQDNNVHYIYAGQEKCPYCRQFVPTLSNFINNKNIQVQYLNLQDISSNDVNYIINIINKNNMKEELKLPIIIKINHGRIVKLITGHYINYNQLLQL